MIGLAPESDLFVLDYGQRLKPGFEQWIVKAESSMTRPISAPKSRPMR